MNCQFNFFRIFSFFSFSFFRVGDYKFFSKNFLLEHIVPLSPLWVNAQQGQKALSFLDVAKDLSPKTWSSILSYWSQSIAFCMRQSLSWKLFRFEHCFLIVRDSKAKGVPKLPKKIFFQNFSIYINSSIRLVIKISILSRSTSSVNGHFGRLNHNLNSLQLAIKTNKCVFSRFLDSCFSVTTGLVPFFKLSIRIQDLQMKCR